MRISAPDALWPNEPVSTHARNPTGRDFVVGDVHGCFPIVEQALRSLEFAPDRDRLFGVGDLIDRGPHSADALDWLETERILAVRGNHERWMVNSLVLEGGRLRISGYCADWLGNGGGWFWGYGEDGNRVKHDVDHKDRRDEWLAALRPMPLVRTIETAGGTVGIAHTLPEAYADWSYLETPLRELHSESPTRAHRYGQGYVPVPGDTLWPRPRITRTDRDAPDLPPAMAGIDLALVGHSAHREARWLRPKVLCIDTGACAPDGHLTVAEIQSGEPELYHFT